MLALVAFGSYARRENLPGCFSPHPDWCRYLRRKVGPSGRSASWTVRKFVPATCSTQSTSTPRAAMAPRSRRYWIPSAISVNCSRPRSRPRSSCGQTKNRDLSDKVNNLRAQIQQSTMQVAVQSSFTEILQRQYDQFSGFVTKGMSSLNELQIRQQSWMRAKSELEELKNSKLRLEAQLTDSEYRLRTNDTEIDAEINAMRSQALDIDQKIANSEASRSIEIHAPSDGYRHCHRGHPGQAVAANAPLLTIVPTSDLQAQLLAPSSAVGFIAAGRTRTAALRRVSLSEIRSVPGER